MAASWGSQDPYKITPAVHQQQLISPARVQDDNDSLESASIRLPSRSRDASPNPHDDNHIASTPPPSSRWKTRRCFPDDWTWEMLSLVFSIACLVTVIVLAVKIDGTLLGQWHLFLQPSTVISIITTGAQSSMMLIISEVIGQLKWLAISSPGSTPGSSNSAARPLVDLETFDSASRGPVGSLTLLYRWKPSKVALATMTYTASVVTMAGLAMGPFAQQIVHIEEETTTADGSIVPSIPVSNQYSYDDGTGVGVLFHLTSGISSSSSSSSNTTTTTTTSAAAGMTGEYEFANTRTSDLYITDNVMKGAFFSGMYGRLEDNFLDFSCPSGNCTWPSFSTLGFCSSCEDVSGTASISERDDPSAMYTVTTPRGSKTQFMDWDFVVVGLQSSAPGYGPGTLSAEVVSFLAVQLGQGNPANAKGATVTECEISWCAQEYDGVVVTNGVVQEGAPRRDIPLYPVRGQALGGSGKTPGLNNNWPVLMTTNNPKDAKSKRNISPVIQSRQSSVYTIGILDILGVSSYFHDNLNVTSNSRKAQAEDTFFGKGQDVIGAMVNITARMTKEIPRRGQLVSSSSSSSSSSSNTSTNSDNTSGPQQQQQPLIITGTSWQQQAVIRIQFAWLALPIALVLLSGVLLVSALLATRSSRTPIWKTSVLPFLYHGFREWDAGQHYDLVGGRLEKLKHMEQYAARDRARIWKSRGGGTWLSK